MAILKRRNILAVLAVLVWGASAWNVSADGFRLADQDAFATARGEAFVATADNASAVYYNPAGITQLEGIQFRAGVYGIYLDPTFTRTNTFHNQNRWAAVPQFFTTYTPDHWPVSFGVGVYSPYGGNMSWPQDTGFRSVALQGSLTYATINPVVALKLAHGLSIAAGLMVNYADLEMEQGLLRTEQPLANYFRFKGDGWSAGYNLGLLWQPHEQISFGVTFRSSATVDLQGRTEFEQQPLRGLYPATNRLASMEFEFPMTVTFGLSYRPTPKWNLEFDADYTDWSSFGTMNLHQQDPPFSLKAVTPVTLDWQPSWMFGFGVTRYFDKGWHASAGYVYNLNSVPDAYYTPLAADMDRQFISLGLGHRGRRLDFDVAYQIGFGGPHTVTGSTPSSTPARFSGQNADGRYDFLSLALIATVGLRF